MMGECGHSMLAKDEPKKKLFNIYRKLLQTLKWKSYLSSYYYLELPFNQLNISLSIIFFFKIFHLKVKTMHLIRNL